MSVLLKPLMLNTLGVRSAVGEANRRKLSFRNVSNVVVQLLHTIKPYSVPAPFSHLANTGTGFPNESAGSFQENKTRQVSFIILLCFYAQERSTMHITNVLTNAHIFPFFIN